MAYDQLQYQWPDFLPSDGLADFWAPLKSSIYTALATKTLVTDSSANLRQISRLRFIPKFFQHGDEPLFRSHYDLSLEYEDRIVQKLRSWGLQTLKKTEMLRIIRLDVEESHSSKPSVIQCAESLGSGWYTTFYNFLVERICCDELHKKSLGQLKILPLFSDGGISWAAPSSITEGHRIYLPRVDDDDSAPLMSPELGFRTIVWASCALPERRPFFTQWGITHVDSALVIDAVLRVNRLGKSRNVTHYVQQLAILFWLNWAPTRSLFSQALRGVDKRKSLINMSNAYFSSDAPHSANVLLNGETEQSCCGFLHDLYFQDKIKSYTNGNRQTWIDWLEQELGVRTYPKLDEYDTTSGSRQLGSLFKEIARKKPSQLVDLLGARWLSEYRFRALEPRLVNELKGIEVLCGSDEKCPLQDTILPTKETVTACQIFGLGSEMRLLLIQGKSDPVPLSDWSFLERFGVCLRPTIEFHLDALKRLTKIPASQNDLSKRVTAVYKGIATVATLADKTKIVVC